MSRSSPGSASRSATGRSTPSSKENSIDCPTHSPYDHEPKCHGRPRRRRAPGEVAGGVREVGDGIAKIAGLTNVSSMEMVTFEDGTNGVALNLEEEQVGAIVLGDASHVAAGPSVTATGKVLSMPVGKKMTGRVVDPLGRPVDGKGPIAADAEYPVEKVAPGVMTREPVTVPLMTGLKAIDAMIPIGRGPRGLIIGDRQTGKTAIAVDAIINQKGQGVHCI